MAVTRSAGIPDDPRDPGGEGPARLRTGEDSASPVLRRSATTSPASVPPHPQSGRRHFLRLVLGHVDLWSAILLLILIILAFATTCNPDGSLGGLFRALISITVCLILYAFAVAGLIAFRDRCYARPVVGTLAILAGLLLSLVVAKCWPDPIYIIAALLLPGFMVLLTYLVLLFWGPPPDVIVMKGDYYPFHAKHH